MKFCNEKVVVAADMSANFESEAILLDQTYGFSFQAVFTGSPVGSFSLQASNDETRFPADVVNWTEIAGSSQTVAAAGNVIWNFNGAFYKWVRCVYVATSGSGSCDVTYMSKGV